MPSVNRADEAREVLSSGQPRKAYANAGKKMSSLFDRRQPYYSGIQRFGLQKFSMYFSDPFHTMLNLPWWKFILLFFSTYFLEFFIFSLLYYSQPRRCIHGLTDFSHALWISSRVASTIGFNEPLVPNAQCPGTNLLIMANVICSSLVDFIMLGIVFARFSAPFKRATTIRFSENAVVYRHSSGFWCLSFRLANIRKHQVLNPEVRVMLTAVDSITPADYAFEYLESHEVHKDCTNLQLGFPAHIVHIIKPGSPLWALSLKEMESRLMEVLVFVDGIDAMTARHMQARKAYYATDILMNEQFLPMHLSRKNGKVGMDFAEFDGTTLAISDATVDSHPQAHLRHQTFKRLTEQAGKPLPSGRTALSTPSASTSNPFDTSKEVEMVAPSDAAASSKDQSLSAAAVVLQLHSVCDAVIADAGSAATVKAQATAAKQRYPLKPAPEGNLI